LLQPVASSDSNTSLAHTVNHPPCTFVGECSPLLDACRHLLLPNGNIIGRHIATTILPLFPTIVSAIPTTTTTAATNNHGGSGETRTPVTHALQSIDGRRGIPHARIVQAVEEFGRTIHSFHGLVVAGRGSRIAVVLPNGPELALAILCVAQWACCVPLSATGAIPELRADLQRCSADVVIGLFDPAHRPIQDCANALNIPFIGLIPSETEAGIFTLQLPTHGSILQAQQGTTTAKIPKMIDTKPNGPMDEILVLFTSGTTGNKKLVPHLQGDIITAAATIALSWNLTPSDINLNMMPLFHGTWLDAMKLVVVVVLYLSERCCLSWALVQPVCKFCPHIYPACL
jgi:acyl-coenzyme A synthetase/AMP-(fatty) acid ligase